MRTRFLAAVAAVAVAGTTTAVLAFGGSPAGAATTVSTPSQSAGWAGNGRVARPVYSTEQPRGTVGAAFGSLKFVTTAATPQRAFYRPGSGKLADVKQVSYDWLKAPDAAGAPTGAAGQVVSFVLWLDLNDAAETVTPLVYEPVYDVVDGKARYPGNVLPTGVWQSDNLLSPEARWYSGQEERYEPFSYFQAKYPDATINLVGLNQGSGNDGVTSYVDNVSVNGAVTNFETDPTKGKASASLTLERCGLVRVEMRNARTSTNTASARFQVSVSGRVYYDAQVAGGQIVINRQGPFAEDSRGGTALVRVTADGVQVASGSFTTNCRR